MTSTSHVTPPAAVPAISIPPLTLLLGKALLAWHLVRLYLLAPVQDEEIVFRLAFIPVRFREMAGHDPQAWLPLISYATLHFGWVHLLMNLAGLIAFGSALERSLGALRLGGILLSGIVGGALLHFALFSAQTVLLGGISAGLSALFAVVLALLQTARHTHLAGWRRWRTLLPAVTAWLLLNLIFGLMGLPQAGGQSVLAIAWVAHVGGFLAGLLWLPVLWPAYRFQNSRRGEMA